jgi:DNA-binding MarR family transcriptional regulator
MVVDTLSDRDYQQLLAFRSELRRFQHWSEEQAAQEGLTPAQHQLLLAIRGHPDGRPTLTDVAAALLLRHHSAVELVDRAEKVDLVRRARDRSDHRLVRLHLTNRGSRKLARLSARHLDELKRLRALQLRGTGF